MDYTDSEQGQYDLDAAKHSEEQVSLPEKYQKPLRLIVNIRKQFEGIISVNIFAVHGSLISGTFLIGNDEYRITLIDLGEGKYSIQGIVDKDFEQIYPPR